MHACIYIIYIYIWCCVCGIFVKAINVYRWDTCTSICIIMNHNVRALSRGDSCAYVGWLLWMLSYGAIGVRKRLPFTVHSLERGNIWSGRTRCYSSHSLSCDFVLAFVFCCYLLNCVGGRAQWALAWVSTWFLCVCHCQWPVTSILQIYSAFPVSPDCPFVPTARQTAAVEITLFESACGNRQIWKGCRHHRKRK